MTDGLASPLLIQLAGVDPDAFNKDAYASWEQQLDKCENCGRTFRPDALKHHRNACKADKPLRPAGTGLR